MRRLLIPLGAAALFFSGNAAAADYALTPDGLGVVRLKPSAPIAASTFDSSLLPSGYTSSTAFFGGSLSVTDYRAGNYNGSGGSRIEAQFTPPATLGYWKNLNWVQVVTTNDPTDGKRSPFLDGETKLPFYNNEHILPPGPLSFYDFPKRPASHLSATNPIVWNASLYPVAYDKHDDSIQVYDGITYGWEMKKAPVGTTSAIFTNPTPAGATVGGVGTSNFAWGAGGIPSLLSFASTSFDTTPGERFKIGTLTFHNGVIDADSGANLVDFEVLMNFTNIPELDFTFKTTFTLTNTTNIDDDPQASADIVSIGSFGYSFHVLEGETASVDVMAILDTSLEGVPGGTSADYAERESGPLDPGPHFVIKGLSFENPGSGGFITQVPEPSTWMLLVVGLACISLVRRYAPQPIEVLRS
jgi:hypothetical protein